MVKNPHATLETRFRSLSQDEMVRSASLTQWNESEQTQVGALCMGNSQGQRSLAHYSPWGHKELDTT